MPQLSIETYVSQYIWLIIILFTLYYLVVTKYLPLLSETFKARRKLETIKSSVTSSSVSDLSKNLIKDIATLKYSSNIPSINFSSPFSISFSSWASSLTK